MINERYAYGKCNGKSHEAHDEKIFRLGDAFIHLDSLMGILAVIGINSCATVIKMTSLPHFRAYAPEIASSRPLHVGNLTRQTSCQVAR